MADNKKSFLLYCEWESTFNMLSNEKAGELIKHIFAYVNDKNPTSSDDLLNIAFEPIKQQFKRDLIKWEDIREKRSLAGKASADKRKQKQQVLTSVESVQQTSTNPTVDVDVDVDVTVNDNVLKDLKGKNKEKIKKENPPSEIIFPFDAPEFISIWNKYKAYRKKKDKFTFYDTDSENRMLTELKNLSKDHQQTAIKIIHQSIDAGYKGLFELKILNGQKQERPKFAKNR